MVVKIFYKDDCPLCPEAKRLREELDRMQLPCEAYDVETVDGLAEASFYGVLSVPSVVVEEGEQVIFEWRGRVPRKEHILELRQRQ